MNRGGSRQEGGFEGYLPWVLTERRLLVQLLVQIRGVDLGDLGQPMSLRTHDGQMGH